MEACEESSLQNCSQGILQQKLARVKGRKQHRQVAKPAYLLQVHLSY